MKDLFCQEKDGGISILYFSETNKTPNKFPRYDLVDIYDQVGI